MVWNSTLDFAFVSFLLLLLFNLSIPLESQRRISSDLVVLEFAFMDCSRSQYHIWNSECPYLTFIFNTPTYFSGECRTSLWLVNLGVKIVVMLLHHRQKVMKWVYNGRYLYQEKHEVLIKNHKKVRSFRYLYLLIQSCSTLVHPLP
jgi:hypothetical protein